MATKTVLCNDCSGTGETIDETTCPTCGGTGTQTVPEPARTSIPPMDKPSSPVLAGPTRGRSGRTALLLALLALAFVGAALFYLLPQRATRNEGEASTADAAPAVAPETPITPPEPPPAVRTPPRSAPQRPRPVQFQAKHKHSLGRRCEGLASFTAGEFVYESDEHPVRLTRANVVRNDGPGLKARGGKDWHFEFSGKNDKEVRLLFEAWYRNRAPLSR